jgi:hypothetical protein
MFLVSGSIAILVVKNQDRKIYKMLKKKRSQVMADRSPYDVVIPQLLYLNPYFRIFYLFQQMF